MSTYTSILGINSITTRDCKAFDMDGTEGIIQLYKGQGCYRTYRDGFGFSVITINGHRFCVESDTLQEATC